MHEIRPIDANSALNDLCGSQCGCRIDECGLNEPCEKARYIIRQPTIKPEVQHGMTLVEAIGYIKVLCDAVGDTPCGCGTCPYGDTVDDDGNCEVMKAINNDEDVITNGTDDYAYYEIWNTTSNINSECTERCVTLETAKDHLENNHCDWSRPFGTGTIYSVKLVPTDDGTINLFRNELYRKR